MKKKLLLIFTLLFSTLMFSTPSYAEWTKVNSNVDGTTTYVDFDRIRKHSGYVYFWYLMDYLKPSVTGRLSDKTYSQVDCKLFRYKWLSVFFHNEPMGGGTGDAFRLSPKYKDWLYPPPNSSIEETLKQVCSQ